MASRVSRFIQPHATCSALLVDLPDLVHNTLEEIWGDNSLFTRIFSWWSLFAPCWLNLVIAPLASISWDCTFCVLSCLALPLRGSPTWHWRVQDPFTMSMSHDMIHHDDGMDQVVLYQLVLYLDFALCGLHCRSKVLLLTLDLSCCMHWLWWEGQYPFRGSLRSEQRVQNPFTMNSLTWILIFLPLHDASWQLLIEILGYKALLPWVAWLFWLSWIDLISLAWSLFVSGHARPPDAFDLALPLASWSCMLNFYTWPLPRSSFHLSFSASTCTVVCLFFCSPRGTCRLRGSVGFGVFYPRGPTSISPSFSWHPLWLLIDNLYILNWLPSGESSRKGWPP